MNTTEWLLDPEITEHDLVHHCPPEFKNISNPWFHYIDSHKLTVVDLGKWSWKPELKDSVHHELLGLFFTIKGGRYVLLGDQDRKIIQAWILSEMLSSVPE